MGRAPESPLERGQARRLPGPAPSHGQRPHVASRGRVSAALAAGPVCMRSAARCCLTVGLESPCPCGSGSPSISICLNRVLHFFTHFRVTLSTDDYLSEHEIWPEIRSSEVPSRPADRSIRRTFVPPVRNSALMFRPMQTARQIEVHVFRVAYLQKIRLVETSVS